MDSIPNLLSDEERAQLIAQERPDLFDAQFHLPGSEDIEETKLVVGLDARPLAILFDAASYGRQVSPRVLQIGVG